VHNKRIPNN